MLCQNMKRQIVSRAFYGCKYTVVRLITVLHYLFIFPLFASKHENMSHSHCVFWCYCTAHKIEQILAHSVPPAMLHPQEIIMLSNCKRVYKALLPSVAPLLHITDLSDRALRFIFHLMFNLVRLFICTKRDVLWKTGHINQMASLRMWHKWGQKVNVTTKELVGVIFHFFLLPWNIFVAERISVRLKIPRGNTRNLSCVGGLNQQQVELNSASY